MKKSWRSKWNWASVRLAAGLLALGAFSAGGQQLEGPLRLNGREVLKAFEPVRVVLQESSAVFYEGWKNINYGVVVSSDGYILAKASEVQPVEELTVRVNREHFEEVRVVATDFDWDVALLKVAAEGLEPVTWGETDGELHGTWVVTNGASSRMRRRARVGVVSANTREIRGGVVLGVVLKTDGEKLVVEKVSERSGAAEAGIKEGDLIVKAEGKELKSRQDLMDLLDDKAPRERILITLDRDGETLEVEVELKTRSKVFKELSRNQAMSGRTSDRRTYFPRVIQTDLMLSPRTTGGPLLDLHGRCLGMIIARSDRAETYAIPAEELQEVFRRLLNRGEREEGEAGEARAEGSDSAEG